MLGQLQSAQYNISLHLHALIIISVIFRHNFPLENKKTLAHLILRLVIIGNLTELCAKVSRRKTSENMKFFNQLPHRAIITLHDMLQACER